MLLPRKSDKSDNYINQITISKVIASQTFRRVTNNVRNDNGPRFKKYCDRLTSQCNSRKSIQDNNAIIASIDTLCKVHKVKYTFDLHLGLPLCIICQ